MPRKGITVYLPRDLELKVEKLARDHHRSESSIITEAVKMRLDRPGSDGVQDESVRRAARTDARLDKAIGEALIIKEAVLLFIRVWLEHNPPVDEAHEASAAASAEARFERFIDLVAQGLQPGRSVSNGALVMPAVESGRPALAASEPAE